MKIKIVIALSFIFYSAFAQKINSDDVIKKVRAEFDKINDYVVDVSVKVDISYIKMPDITAKIYFKKPDKLHIKSKGFALLPKQGINFSPDLLFEKKYQSIYEGGKEIDDINYHVIKIIPEETEVGPSLITIYVNPESHTIRRVVTIGERRGKFEMDIFHKLIDDKYWLPEKVEAVMDVGDFRFGRRRQTERELKPNSNVKDKQPGRVILIYSNYLVNKGIDDKIFEKNENKR